MNIKDLYNIIHKDVKETGKHRDIIEIEEQDYIEILKGFESLGWYDDSDLLKNDTLSIQGPLGPVKIRYNKKKKVFAAELKKILNEN